jgi:hypothetical protein
LTSKDGKIVLRGRRVVLGAAIPVYRSLLQIATTSCSDRQLDELFFWDGFLIALRARFDGEQSHRADGYRADTEEGTTRTFSGFEAAPSSTSTWLSNDLGQAFVAVMAGYQTGTEIIPAPSVPTLKDPS